MTRWTSGFVCVFVFSLATALAVTTASFQADEDRRPRLAAHPESRSESLVADILAESSEGARDSVAPDGRVRVVAATREGMQAEFAASLPRVGATVVFSDDTLGYFELLVPKERLLSLSSHPGLEAIDVDGSASPALARGDSTCQVQPKRSSPSIDPEDSVDAASLSTETADLAAKTGRAALRVDGLQQQHPTFDGRGVTIAIIEGGTTGVPLAHRAYASAKDLNGAVVPKIVDLVLVSPGWRMCAMETRVHTTGAAVRFEARDVRLPHTGEFHLGRLKTPWQTYDVAWDKAADTAWVDVDRDGDFSGETPLRDARTHREDIAEFPNVPGRGTARFRITTDLQGNRIFVHLASPPSSSNHAGMSSTVATGSDELARGVAPAARLMLIDPIDGDTGSLRLSHIVRAFILASRRPEVDIISSSFTISATPLPADDIVSVMADRLVRRYHKILIVGASNLRTRDIAQTIGTYSVSVGAYLSGAVERQTDHADPREHWVASSSARGPRGDGDARPDVVAPAVWPAIGRCARQPAPGAAAACLQLSRGTSAAAPALAGAVGLLVSGARQNRMTLAGEHVRALLRASAVFLPGWSAADQGAGIPDLITAWKLLGSQRDWPAVIGSAPLDDERRGFMSADGGGRGLYLKKWTTGTAGDATLTVTRMSGSESPTPFNLDWTGNDGTFRTEERIALPLNTPVRLRVAIHPRTSGLHSALLNVRDSTTGTIVYQAQPTVIATSPADDLRTSGLLPRLGREESTVAVPEGTTALRLRVKANADIMVGVSEPSGWPFSPVVLLTDAHREHGFDLLVANPAAGTWQMGMQSDADTPVVLEYTASLLSMRAEPARRPSDRPSDQAVQTRIVMRDVPSGSWPRNLRGLVGRLTHQIHGRTSAAQPDVQSIQVAENGTGASALVFRATALGSVRDRLTMYVYGCPGGRCARLETIRSWEGTAVTRFETPKSGLWKVVVFADSSRPVPYKLDVIAAPSDQRTGGATVECRPESGDAFLCTTSPFQPSGVDAPLVGLFDVPLPREERGDVCCALTCNRPVPVGVLVELPPNPLTTARSSAQ